MDSPEQPLLSLVLPTDDATLAELKRVFATTGHMAIVPPGNEVTAVRIGYTSEETRERLAAYAHEAWAGWMRYLFRFGTQHADGTFTIDADKVTRWRRQMETSYTELPEQERASDRTEADAILAIVHMEPAP